MHKSITSLAVQNKVSMNDHIEMTGQSAGKATHYQYILLNSCPIGNDVGKPDSLKDFNNSSLLGITVAVWLGMKFYSTSALVVLQLYHADQRWQVLRGKISKNVYSYRQLSSYWITQMFIHMSQITRLKKNPLRLLQKMTSYLVQRVSRLKDDGRQ